MQLQKSEDVERLRSILKEMQLSEGHRQEIEAWLAESSNLKTDTIAQDSSRKSVVGSGFKSTKETLSRLDASDRNLYSSVGFDAHSRSFLEYIYIVSGLIIILCIAAGIFWVSTSSLLSGSERSSVTVSPNNPYVLVSFDEQATIAEITQVLQKLGLGIAAGPLSGGVYRVDIPVNTGAKFDELSSQLQTAPSIMWLVSGLRPSE